MVRSTKRRGRPPVAASERKSKNFTFRSRGDLHDRLTDAAARSGRSISEEIEIRITRSFDDEQQIWGSREIYGLMRVIAAAIHETGSSAGFYATRTAEGA